ncbi:MAG: radical SAM protein [Bacillota bacterium]|nr:radical SAM protein [Bacillota bacterium]
MNNNVLERTQSICPICHKAIEAFYIEENNKIYFTKECSEHGRFTVLAAENADDFKVWMENQMINIPPKSAQTAGDPEDKSCPLYCGTCTNHLQTACCVLIDITDRCNQHCPYCFARSENDADRSSEPTLEELSNKFDLLLALGEERPFNIQLSGGEPTVRDDLPEIIKLAKSKGFEYIQINTNGRRLAKEEGYAKVLKDAGASVIFLQFDGTRDEIYEALRGEPLLKIKEAAIRNCGIAGLAVTLVPTVVEGINTDNIGEMMEFLVKNVSVVKGIHFQPVSFFGRHPEKVEGGMQSADFPGRITMFGMLREMEKQAPEFKYDHFCPITTGHPLCCFYSTYIKEPDGSVRCTMTETRKQQGISCCEPGAVNKAEVIRKDRDFVLNKWDVLAPEEAAKNDWSQYGSSKEIINLIDFLTYYKQNTFTVTGMGFMDVMNLDAERVKRCRVQVLSEDDKLIPFCAYNSIWR